jgi:uncharacterized protein YbjT (DUF2867 family)
MAKTAIILGASGLVGNEVLIQLIADADFEKIKLFVRTPLSINHPKLEQHIVNFDDEESFKHLIAGDVLFCCLGTTIKTAGSQEAFKKIDHHYPLVFAKIAKQNGVKKHLIISSLGANKNATNFYLRTKGEIEFDLSNLNFESLIIVRPSMLLGNRKEFRLGESIGKLVMKAISFLFIGKLKRYKAIEARDVAKAMIKLSKTNSIGITVAQSDRLMQIASN